jgi:tRNA(Ile)-lysidine synthase
VSASSQRFSGDQLLASLARLPTPRKYWIGFSGGADSTALLQGLHECRDRLAATIHAVHFHHGLQTEADDWQEHCRDFCDLRDLPYRAVKLEIDSSGRTSPEEAARNSRYRAVAALLGQQEMYLTAHHAEDLAETLFLNLMRGSGVEGLAGIPVLRNLGHGWVARPLLEMHRCDLEAFLAERGIEWLTDPSNADTSFDRNYVRQALFPQLEQRWPGLVRRLSRTARNARITANAMAMFIESQSGDLMRDELKMPLDKLLELDPEMRTLILRQWLRRHEVPALPEQRLREFLKQVSDVSVDSRAEVQWDGWMIKHYKLQLWLHRSEPFPGFRERAWQEGMQLDLGTDSGQLVLRGEPTAIPPGWAVRTRQPGDRIRAHPHGSSQKLKDLFQAAAVPPWLRPGVPVLEWAGEAVALGDWVLGHRLRDWLLEHGLEYRWEPADPVLARLRSDCQSLSS